MSISAAMVKELRERTSAGMMECKKALVEADGDMEKAIENMRISGLAKADKKSDRIAAEGVVVFAKSEDGKRLAMVEINCETDFVVKADDFKNFSDMVVNLALEANTSDIEVLGSTAVASHEGKSLSEVRQELVAKIGENIQLRRVTVLEAAAGGAVGVYLHGSRIGVVASIDKDNQDLVKDLAMHVAASNPVCIDESGVPADTLERERNILVAEAKESGKPDNIIEKMVDGRMRKYLAEITLVGQPFVKDPDQTVAKLLAAAGATCTGFTRFAVGEGIEKKSENFAEEVMAQANAQSK